MLPNKIVDDRFICVLSLLTLRNNLSSVVTCFIIRLTKYSVYKPEKPNSGPVHSQADRESDKEGGCTHGNQDDGG